MKTLSRLVYHLAIPHSITVGFRINCMEATATVSYSFQERRASEPLMLLSPDQKAAFIFDRTTGKELLSIHVEATVQNIAFSSSGKMLIIISDDNNASFWNIPTQQQLLQVYLDAKVEGVKFSPENKMIVIGLVYGTSTIIDISTRKQLLQISHRAPLKA